MSENLPNHSEQWDDLPLPNEEEAWQKMKRLLDKEERRRFLPFWWWRYGLFGLLLIGVAAGGYFLLNRSVDKQIATKPIKKDVQQQERNEQQHERRELLEKKALSPRNSVTVQRALEGNKETELKNNTVQHNSVATIPDKKEASNNRISLQQTRPARVNFFNRNQIKSSGNKIRALRRKQWFQEKQMQHTEKIPVDNGAVKKRDEAESVLHKSQPIIAPANKELQKKTDSLKQDVTKAYVDSTDAKDSAKTSTVPVASTEHKKEKAKKSRIQFSAGVGLQQALAFNGQRTTSYDSTGRRFGWFDYIPSVYLQLKKGKWALKAEFNYRVPQLVKPFSYSQTTSYDSTNNLLRTEKFSIQKLYYRQVLLSINRFVLPNWSWGVGGTYNLLAGAIVEQQMEDKNVSTGGEIFWRNPSTVKGYRDSFLYKSTVGILFQTDYHWKRVSLGLRYTKNLQPFIKYTKPDGAVLEDKSQALQAVLRFRAL